MTLNEVIAEPVLIAPSLSTNPKEEISLCVSLPGKEIIVLWDTYCHELSHQSWAAAAV